MQHDPLERDEALKQRLASLPDERQPYGFTEFQRRAASPAGRRPRFAHRAVWATAAMALSVALSVALVAFLLHGRGELGGGRAPQAPPLRPPSGPSPAPIPPAQAIVQPSHAGQAEALEGWLASLPPERAMVRVGARAAVASLEDRIALLDDVMSAERAARAPKARLAAIEEQRSQVLRSLVQVRYAEGLATGPY